MASHILFTQVKLDEDRLFQRAVQMWLSTQRVLKQQDVDIESLMNSQTIQKYSFDSKSDFKKKLPELYRRSGTNSMLYLGDLSQYSIPMQEGMLRLLEEPPLGKDIIISAPDESRILPTIQSRCQIHTLNFQDVIQSIGEDEISNIKKLLPPVKQTTQELLQDRFVAFKIPPKIERYVIDMWLWQLSVNIKEVYKQHPRKDISHIVYKISRARQLNQNNVQKRFVVEQLAL